MSQLIVTRWTVKTDGVIAPDERLPWPQTIAMGLQHVVAMFGATVLAPLLMGFDPNVAILMSGVGTLIFFVVTGGRVPSYLGSSFAFIGVVIAATGYAGSGGNPNLGTALGGIIACGRAVRGHRSRGDGGGHPLDRAADAADRDRGGRRGHRPQPRADRREERERLHLRRVDGGPHHRRGGGGGGVHPRHGAPPADPRRPGDRLRGLRAPCQRHGPRQAGRLRRRGERRLARAAAVRGARTSASRRSR